MYYLCSMGFTDIFKDDNDINEKSVVGFISFAIMILVMLIDIITGWCGKDLVVNEFIYNSFLFITLGCFGISGLEKFSQKK